MGEYICKEDLIKEIENDCPNLVYYSKKEAIECIEVMNAADVEPVVHAKWVEYPRVHYFKCGNCKYTVPYKKAMLYNGKREYNYCPNCGAKMDLEK